MFLENRYQHSGHYWLFFEDVSDSMHSGFLWIVFEFKSLPLFFRNLWFVYSLNWINRLFLMIVHKPVQDVIDNLVCSTVWLIRSKTFVKFNLSTWKLFSFWSFSFNICICTYLSQYLVLELAQQDHWWLVPSNWTVFDDAKTWNWFNLV